MGVSGFQPDSDQKAAPVTTDFLLALPPRMWLRWLPVVIPTYELVGWRL